MFVASNRTWYDRHGGQHASGAFLILCLGDAFKPWTGGNLRAMVRHVKMSQLGQFMAGYVIIPTTYWQAPSEGKPGCAMPARAKLHLSGTFGGDGLPMRVPTKVVLVKGLREQPINMDWRLLTEADVGRAAHPAPKEHTPESPCWYAKGVPFQVYERMAPVPDDIADAMAHDETGHNSAGVQAIGKLGPWARSNHALLSRAGGPRSPFPRPTVNTYEVWDLDVWGNALNGYDINDWMRTGDTVTFTSDMDDAAMLKVLRDQGIVTRKVTARSFTMDDPSCDGETFTLVDNRRPRLKKSDETAVVDGHGKPVLGFRKVRAEHE